MITQAKQVEEEKHEEQTLKSYMNINNSDDEEKESEMWTLKRDVINPIVIQKEPQLNALDMLDNLRYKGSKGKPVGGQSLKGSIDKIQSVTVQCANLNKRIVQAEEVRKVIQKTCSSILLIGSK